VLTSLRIGVGHLNEIESGDVDSTKARIARASLPEADTTRFGADAVVE
jgi:hypothetical protein